MTLRLLALAALLLPAAAHAQLSVYADAALTGYGFNDSSTASFKSNSGGFILGAYYDFPIQSRLTLGVDLRTSYSPGGNGGTFTAGALRLGFVPHHVRLRPFLQIGGGVVSTTGITYTVVSSGFSSSLIYSSQRYTNGAAEVSVGLDIRLTSHVDLRALDYGALAGASDNNTTAAGAFLGTGLVYHLHPR